MEGWIKLHRSLLNWEWYKNLETKALFIHLLLKVNYENKKWQGVDIARGSYITSISILADELALTPRKIRTAIKNLKSTHDIEVETTNKYSRITIVNYGKYQGCMEENDKQSEQQVDTQATSKRQQLKKEINKEDNIYLFNNNEFDVYDSDIDFQNYLKTKGIFNKQTFNKLSSSEQELLSEKFVMGG